MKRSIAAVSLSVLAVVAIVGCGGGGGGSSSLVKLTPEKIDALGKSVHTILPECGYNSPNASFVADDGGSGTPYKVLNKNLKEIDTLHRLDRPVSGTIGGSFNCGWTDQERGKINYSGTHDNGDDTLVYNFDHYCTTNANGEKTILTGKMDVFRDGTPPTGGVGRVINSRTYSTQGGGLQTTVETDHVKKTTTTKINQLVYTDGTKAVTADKMEFVEGGKSYTVTHLDAVKEKGSYRVKKATYTDPDAGTVNISMDKLSEKSTITVTGTDGTKAVFKGTGDGSFTYTDGSDIYKLSCNTVK